MARELSDLELSKIEDGLRWQITGKNKTDWKLNEGVPAKYAQRNRLIFALQLASGLRIASTCAVRVGWVRTPEGKIRDIMRVPKEFIKGGKDRTITQPDGTVKVKKSKKKAFPVCITPLREQIQEYLAACKFPLTDEDTLFFSNKTKKKKPAAEGKESAAKRMRVKNPIKGINPKSIENMYHALFFCLGLADADEPGVVATHR